MGAAICALRDSFKGLLTGEGDLGDEVVRLATGGSTLVASAEARMGAARVCAFGAPLEG